MMAAAQQDTQQKIIVMGASRGGLAAIRHVLESLQPGFAASVLIALHPKLDSARTRIADWRGWTRLPIRYAEHGAQILPGEIYLTPPHQLLEVRDDLTLSLIPVSNESPSEHWADRLFITAAHVYGDRTIGVILTGGDSDGAQGMKAIHAAGGTGIVQEPSDALDPSMPLSSLRIDHPDYCVPLRDIADLLNTLAHQ